MTESLIAGFKSARTEKYLQKRYAFKYAFVGMGQHSLSNLYPVINYLGVPLKYICVTSQQKADEISAKFPGVKGICDLDEILRDEEVRGVFVAASPSAHFQIAGRLLHAGKHIFIEKPPCMSVQELDILEDMARQMKLCACAGLQKRYAPAVKALAERICNEKIVNYDLHYRTGLYPEGDPVWDLYIHPVDLACHLFGAADSLEVRKIGLGSYLCLMHHETGATGTLELSTEYTWGHAQESLEVCTDKGHYVLEPLDRLTFTPRSKSLLGVPVEKVLGNVVETRTLYSRNTFSPILSGNEIVAGGFFGEIESFVETVEGRKGVILSDLDSLRNTFKVLERLTR